MKIRLTLLGLVVAVGLSACSRTPPPPPPPPPLVPVLERKSPAGVTIPFVRFTDVTESSGIRFVHVNGAFGKKLLPETMGSGVACFDYDNDGRQDILFVNSCYWPGHEETGKPKPTLALYRNLGSGKFTEVTQETGLAVTMYGMGVTVGDCDNDGWADVFVTGVGGNRLFRNVASGGKRVFIEVTQSAGVGGAGWWPTNGVNFLDVHKPMTFSSSAAFLDYDGDALLDLFVCNYVVWSPQIDLTQNFQLVGVGRAYGPPTAFEGTQCYLYRNLGNGRFEEVGAKAGIHVFGTLNRAVGKSLGVIVFDADEDGWPDIVIGNDTVRNFFFHNKGDGTFEEIGEMAGVALAEGRARGAMGTDVGEVRPGRYSVLIGNFANEPNTLLRLDNPKQLLFSDAAVAEGVAGPSRLLLKFGLFFFDYDLDGRQDFLTCNGHLEPEINKVETSQTYKQPPQLFWNCGGKSSYVPVTAQEVGPDLLVPIVGRGCAYADIDDDGDLDVVLTENGGPARLLRNDLDPKPNWVRLVLEGDGKRSNRDAIGARVHVEAGGVVQRREVVSGRGYLSQCELPLTFGLGKAAKVERVTIYWPGPQGGKTELHDLAPNQVHRIRQQ